MKKKKVKGKIFISFVEEAILNPKYEGYIVGRIEVQYPNEAYPLEEIRFFTKDKEYYKFRDEWDMKDINGNELEKIRKTVRERFMDIR